MTQEQLTKGPLKTEVEEDQDEKPSVVCFKELTLLVDHDLNERRSG